MVSRESIMAALFTRVSAASGFATMSRTLKSFADVAAAEMPALFQAEGPQVAVGGYRTPTKWTFHVELFLYVHEQTGAGSSLSASLNLALDSALAAIVGPVEGQPITLGNLVTDVRVNGTVELYEGNANGKVAVAIIPLELTANA